MLDILDTAGQEEYSSMRDQYMQSGQGFVLVYSVTAPSSFDDIKGFRDQILKVKEAEKNVPMVLAGNKIDLEDDRAVTTDEGEELAKTFECAFYETSAKTCVNIQELFFDLVRQINQAGGPTEATEENLSPTEQREAAPKEATPAKKKKKGGCVLL